MQSVAPAWITAFSLMALTTAAVEELPPMEVSATRIQGEAFDQPYAFYRQADPELGQLVGRTVLDRSNYGPGVFIQRTAPDQASPFIRGLTGEQALLTLDGVRLNHAFMRPGPNQYVALVPEVSVVAVDAVLGPSSVVNGSDGLTGLLDLRLADPGRGVSQPFSPWVSARVDTGNGATYSAGVDGLDGNWLYSLELSATHFHDRIGGKDFRDRVFGEGARDGQAIPNTAYDAWGGGVRLAYLGFADRVLTLKAGYSEHLEAPRPDGYFENSGKADRLFRYFDPQTFTYLHLRDRVDMGTATVDTLQTTLWWHRFEEHQFRSSVRDRGTPDQRLRRREYDNRLNAFGTDIQATTLLGPTEAHTLTWGGTFIYERTDNAYREFRTPSGSLDESTFAPHQPDNWSNRTTVSDGSEYNTLGLYAQDQWRLAPSFSLLAGARYSRVDWTFGQVEGDTSDVTGSLRAQWEPLEEHRFFVGTSRGFRAPNLTNLDGSVDRGSSGVEAEGNPELDSEVSLTGEAGWKWRRGRDQFMFTAFATRIDDLVQPDYRTSGTFRNGEGADLQGFESAWDLGVVGEEEGPLRIAAVGAVSLVDATQELPQPDGSVIEDNLSRANRLYGRGGLRVEQGTHWWGLLQVRWHAAYDEVARDDSGDVRLTVPGDAQGRLPGYGVVDLLLGWNSADGHRRYGVFVENLADKTYREVGSGVDGVGRSYGVTCHLRF